MEHRETPPLTLAPEASPDEATMRAIAAGLVAYDAGFAPQADRYPRWIIGRDGGGAVRAGLRFMLAYDWLFVHWLWVAEPYRKQGIGSRLLAGAEAAAQRRAAAEPISTRSRFRRRNSTIDTDIWNSAGSMITLPAMRGFGS